MIAQKKDTLDNSCTAFSEAIILQKHHNYINIISNFISTHTLKHIRHKDCVRIGRGRQRGPDTLLSGVSADMVVTFHL